MRREIVAILRGVHPREVVDIGHRLIESGITIIEVPLNSPEPLKSISLLSDAFSDVAEIGAGTVLSVDQVREVAQAGGKLIVSPDTSPAVIEATKDAGLQSFPGVSTATECFTALRHGADALKFFPSFVLGPRGFSALSAVLPSGTKTYAVGGVGPADFSDWFAAGITGFGIGSELYKAGISAGEVTIRAAEIVAAYDRASGNG